ncbi:MAG TPA: MFS transporter [Ktedonobacteraceae bacterium]|nr:MFS transporter [Ktedonobacteraceae bacterium]
MKRSVSPVHRESLQKNVKWLTLTAMCCGLFLINLDTSVVNVALPTIQRQFMASTASLQWIINGYLLALAVLLVTVGKLCDLYGRKKIYTIGLAIFTLASLGCGLAPSLSFLIGFRALQGLGGSIVLAGGLSIISITFMGKQLASAIGIWAGIAGLALVAGPVVGGVLVEYLGWRSMFLINIPFGVIGLFIVLRVLNEIAGETITPRIDVAGIVTLTPGIFALTMAFIEGQSWGWTSLSILGLVGIAVLLLAVFVGIELRQTQPMVPFHLFRSYTFTALSIVSFIIFFVMYSSLFFITLFLQDVLGYSALQAGLGITPMAIMIMICPPIAGRLVESFGGRAVIFMGLIIFTLGVFLFAYLLAPHAAYSSLLFAMLLIGIGNGSTVSTVSAVAMGSVEYSSSGVASGIINMSRQLGGAFGVAILGAIFATRARISTTAMVSHLPVSAQAKTQLAQEAGSGEHTVLFLHNISTIMRNAQDAMLTGTVYGMQIAMTIAASFCVIAILLALKLKRPVTESLSTGEPSALPTIESTI